ncbi:hypothetical protein MNBD_BACTEROID06-578 [hydrothermal vent metagenome]|uniref:Uncharacterized protein n=1 Tax=hydrothermal vent metagenome TaxID=652676 RepID=A0A3B0U8H0_9ZZZZ
MRIIIIFIILFTSISISKADSWKKPKVTRHFSENGEFMLKVVPRYIPKKYYKWVKAKPNRKKRFKIQDTTIIHCHAILYKVNGARDTVEIWNKKLINTVAPVSVLVSDDGQRVVTFDNWRSLGYGLDVFVVYNELGELVKRYPLDEFTVFPLNEYIFSVSSIWWRCGTQILNDKQKIKLCMQTEDGRKGEVLYNLETFQFENAP